MREPNYPHIHDYINGYLEIENTEGFNPIRNTYNGVHVNVLMSTGNCPDLEKERNKTYNKRLIWANELGQLRGLKS
jgi:hypothetical protein